MAGVGDGNGGGVVVSESIASKEFESFHPTKLLSTSLFIITDFFPSPVQVDSSDENVVSVEKSKVNRSIVRSWWDQTNQKGNLYDLDDVMLLDGKRLEYYM